MDRSGYVSRANELLKVHEESKYQAFLNTQVVLNGRQQHIFFYVLL